eukprot:CAMPEP_0116541122 /NCGR_PEP_ID=MMETSP0397-20121206/315_1 /TAXON_ID=216820 /ORGANISM="Cyclophora tenuis, Strain ECT3854" /LENGTH=147 /DNA_ID=CAMNT_0004065045 /DNA_START=75 /DNA_END=514 /DNA_ORIENTATION=-
MVEEELIVKPKSGESNALESRSLLEQFVVENAGGKAAVGLKSERERVGCTSYFDTSVVVAGPSSNNSGPSMSWKAQHEERCVDQLPDAVPLANRNDVFAHCVVSPKAGDAEKSDSLPRSRFLDDQLSDNEEVMMYGGSGVDELEGDT